MLDALALMIISHWMENLIIAEREIQLKISFLVKPLISLKKTLE